MKKTITCGLCATALIMTGCDKNKEKDIYIDSTTMYINTTESVDISTYNGFRLTDSNIIKNKDGSYQLILDFKQLFR